MKTPDTIADYLVALNASLVTSLDRAERILTEIEDYLRNDANERVARGATAQEAERAAIAQLGPPHEVARRFGSDLSGSLNEHLWRNLERFDRWRLYHPWLGAIVVPTLPVTAFFAGMTLLMAPLLGSSHGPPNDWWVIIVLSSLLTFAAYGARNRALLGRPEPSFRTRQGQWSMEHPWLAASVAMSPIIIGVTRGIPTPQGVSFLTVFGLLVFLKMGFGHRGHATRPQPHPDALDSAPPVVTRPSLIAASVSFLERHWFSIALPAAWVVIFRRWDLPVLLVAGWLTQRVAVSLVGRKRDAATPAARYSAWAHEHPWLEPVLGFGASLIPLLTWIIWTSGPFPRLLWIMLPLCLMVAIVVIRLATAARKQHKESLPQDLLADAERI